MSEHPIFTACAAASKAINRAFVVTQFVKELLDDFHEQVKTRKKKRLKVALPSPSGVVMDRFATKEEISAVLSESIDTTIYQQAFISSVSTIEDCVSSCLRYSLKKHPQKLNIAIDGEKLDKSVPLDNVFAATKIVDGEVFISLNSAPKQMIGPFMKITDCSYRCDTVDSGTHSLYKREGYGWFYCWDRVQMHPLLVDCRALEK